jgi:hypothetical protein
MKTGRRFSVFAFISTLVLVIIAISPPVRAVTVGFDQISWGDGNGGFEDQYSQWGQATVSFDGGDIGSLTPFGSGYMGWVNIVTSVGGGSNNNWAVQNEPVVFDSAGDITSDLPESYNFDLGQTDGLNVGTLSYSINLSATPLVSEPIGTLTLASVVGYTEVEGTTTDPGSEGDEAGTAAQDAVGSEGAATASTAGRGSIKTTTSNIASVNEAKNGCAPGAAARSIKYLGSMFPSLNITQSAQGVYGTLTNYMQTTKTGGTMISNFVSGKNLYFTTNNLQIAPTVVTTNFAAAISALNSTGDVELGVSWGPGRGGHCVFVTGVTTLYTNGVPYRYVVNVIQDPAQGSGSTTNGTDTYTFDTSGNMLNRSAGARVNSFRIEMATVPEPSSMAMAALGLGALASSFAFRRRKRRRT